VVLSGFENEARKINHEGHEPTRRADRNWLDEESITNELPYFRFAFFIFFLFDLASSLLRRDGRGCGGEAAVF
jgi:hypothetical protein